jgi:hypothetical protein
MHLTFLERKILEVVKKGDFDYEDVAPKSRAGVLASLRKKEFIKYRYRYLIFDGKRERIENRTPTITDAGKKALRKPPPANQATEYKARQGLRKFFGLEKIKRLRRLNY